MDSVTQFALGAAVGAAMLGPRIGVRKAVVLGGIYGTLPDLDSLLPTEDPVDSFISHRGATHSLFIQAMATPVFAEPLVRLFAGLRDQRIKTYLAVYLIFATHAIIDAMTIYGTRLLMPIYDGPVGVGSIFIIDPLYTLPLLIVTIWGLFVGGWTAGYGRWLKRALIVSSLYMALSVPLQTVMKSRALTTLNEMGVAATSENTLTIPAPFSLFYWKSAVVEDDRYINLYQPLFDDDAHAYAHPRRGDLLEPLAAVPAFRDLAAFSKGSYSISTDEQNIIFSDLRMGLTPTYAFRFAVARQGLDGSLVPIVPVRPPSQRRQEGDLEWLLAGIAQSPILRPAEQGQLLFVSPN